MQLNFLGRLEGLGKAHSDGKESTCNTGDPGMIPRLGRSPGGGNGSPLQYSCLENPMDGGAWRATVRGLHRVGHNSKSNTNTGSLCFEEYKEGLEKSLFLLLLILKCLQLRRILGPRWRVLGSLYP